jgi:hypothetical protein
MFGQSKKNYEREMNRSIKKKKDDIKYGRKEGREYATAKKAERKSKWERYDRPVTKRSIIGGISSAVHRAVKSTTKSTSRKGGAYRFGGMRVNVGTQTIRGKKQRVKTGPGRPKGSYKHVDPRTGEQVPATTYYKIRRALRNRQRLIAEQARLKQQAMLARRGVSPQVARQVIMERRVQNSQLQAPVVTPEQTQVQTMKTQPIAQNGEFKQHPRFRIEEDIMTGRKIIRPLPPKERWLQ